jgi:hypothetical protein
MSVNGELKNRIRIYDMIYSVPDYLFGMAQALSEIDTFDPIPWSSVKKRCTATSERVLSNYFIDLSDLIFEQSGQYYRLYRNGNRVFLNAKAQ